MMISEPPPSVKLLAKGKSNPRLEAIGLRSAACLVVVLALMQLTAPLWAQCEVGQLVPPDADPIWRYGFGRTIALGERTALVGGMASFSGFHDQPDTVYVYESNGASWQLSQILGGDGGFGRSAAIDGNWAVVGAWWWQEILGESVGYAQLLNRTGDAWAHETILGAPDGVAGDKFGGAVSICGAVVVVGAPDDDLPGKPDAGSAYVFRRNDCAWQFEQHLVAADAASGDSFGYAVAVSGDVILIGSRSANNPGGADAGSAYIFRFDRGNTQHWLQEQKLTAGDASESDRFGSSVSLRGGLAAVGAPLDDAPNANSGSAYAFRYVPTNPEGMRWEQEGETGSGGKLTPSNPTAYGGFGTSVMIDPDGSSVAVGGLASAYVFRFNGEAWVQDIHIPSNEQSDYFGSVLAYDGDSLIVGAPNGGDSGRCRAFSTGPDCNSNGVSDECDLLSQSSEDLDDNGIPDECQELYELPDFIWSIYLESNTDDPGDHLGHRPPNPNPNPGGYVSPDESRSADEPPVSANNDKFFMNWFYKYHPESCGTGPEPSAHWYKNAGLYPMPGGEALRETGQDTVRLKAHLTDLRGTNCSLPECAVYINHTFPWWYVEPVMRDRDLVACNSNQYIRIRSRNPNDPVVKELVDRYVASHRWDLMDKLMHAIWDSGCEPFPIIGEMTLMPYFRPDGEEQWQRDAGPDGLGTTDDSSILGASAVSARDRYLDHLYLHARAVVQHCRDIGLARADRKTVKLWNLENELNTRPLTARTGYFPSIHVDGKNCCGSLLADYEFLGEVLQTLRDAVKHADPRANVLHNFEADFDGELLRALDAIFECAADIYAWVAGGPLPACLSLFGQQPVLASCLFANSFGGDIARLQAASATKAWTTTLRDWAAYVDVIGIDAFPYSHTSEYYFYRIIDKLAQARAIAGTDKKVMLTETMYYTHGVGGFCDLQDWDPSKQADYLARVAFDVHQAALGTDPNIIGFGWFNFSSMEQYGTTAIDAMESMGGYSGLIQFVNAASEPDDATTDQYYPAWSRYKEIIGGSVHPPLPAYPGEFRAITWPEAVPATPPGNVTNFCVQSLANAFLRFTWHAPGDNGGEGRAARYLLRAATEAINTPEDWTGAENLRVVHVPQQPKGLDCPEDLLMRVKLPSGQWHFAIRAVDDDGNLGPITSWSSLLIVAGDQDGDGAVDLDDYEQFSNCTCDQIDQEQCNAVFDLNDDGEIDLGDFSAFQNGFTGS